MLPLTPPNFRHFSRRRTVLYASAMTPNLDRLVALAIVAVLAGTFAGVVFRGKHGLGDGGNFLLGLSGAVVGGWVFTLLNTDLLLGVVQISIGDVVEALLSVLVLAGLVALLKRQSRQRESSKI